MKRWSSHLTRGEVIVDGMSGEGRDPERDLKALVDEYRARCLWFLRRDYYPVTPAEWSRVLGYIERNGDLQAFRRASALRQWLSHPSNARSVAS